MNLEEFFVSPVSIRRMRRFYEMYLIWLHFQELIRIDRKEELIKIIKDEKELIELAKENEKE